MQDSIFTKIIKGEIPSHKIYEDEKVYAFLDIYPASTGHVLVVPKKQVEFVWDLPDEDYEALVKAAKKIALHVREKTGSKYVGSAVIGTDVPHAHIHLIPFNLSSQFYNIGHNKEEPNHEELAKIAEQLRLE